MSADSKAKTALFAVAAVAIVAVIGYAMYSGRGAEIEVPGAVRVKLAEKAASAPGAEKTVTGNQVSSEAPSDYVIQPPGEERILMSTIDAIYVEPPSDDPQAKHEALIGDMFKAGEQQKLYKESDDAGMFSAWITSGVIYENKRCVNYTTLYETWRGRKEVGFRLACPDGDSWTWQISPGFVQLVREAETPQ